jgi:hypothetical protein
VTCFGIVNVALQPRRGLPQAKGRRVADAGEIRRRRHGITPIGSGWSKGQTTRRDV